MGKVSARLVNKRTSEKHPKYSIKISQNKGKSPGDLRRLAATIPPVRNHQLTFV